MAEKLGVLLPCSPLFDTQINKLDIFLAGPFEPCLVGSRRRTDTHVSLLSLSSLIKKKVLTPLEILTLSLPKQKITATSRYDSRPERSERCPGEQINDDRDGFLVDLHEGQDSSRNSSWIILNPITRGCRTDFGLSAVNENKHSSEILTN